jgi:protein O-GlcNAc transferase
MRMRSIWRNAGCEFDGLQEFHGMGHSSNHHRTGWQETYERGRQALRLGALDKAILDLTDAARLKPQSPAAHHDLGVALHLDGRYSEAHVAFSKALALDKDISQAWFNGANTLCALNKYEEAVSWYRRALQLRPDYPDACYNLANTMKRLGRYRDAMEYYQRAIQGNPGLIDAYINLGTLLLNAGSYSDALGWFQKALMLDERAVRALYNAGLSLSRMGRLSEAIGCATKCLELQSGHGEALVLLVTLLQQACQWRALRQADAQLERLSELQLKNGIKPSEPPFLTFTRSMDSGRNLRIAAAWSKWLLANQTQPIIQFDPSRRRNHKKRIRVGYLSERFRNAASAHLTAGVYCRHDRNRFEIFAYSWGADDGSIYRKKIETGVDRFVDIRSMPDEAAARRIHEDRVDILIDMMGWMHGHRMNILAHRPAPIQATYLGYPGTTGAPFMDYLLADKIVVPESQKAHYSEKVIYLPNCYQATDPQTPVDSTPCNRTDFALPHDGIVFCSFNTDYKIDPQSFRLWMRILRRVPGSVLWLLVRSKVTQENLCREAADAGVEPHRLVFAAPLEKPKHLARLKLADLALDTLIVNGHTTTSDALWMGVPVITSPGRHFASRVAASILNAAGLKELAVDSIEQYEELAVTLAQDGSLRSGLKDKLAVSKRSCPLFDVDGYVKDLERAYLQMWDFRFD